MIIKTVDRYADSGSEFAPGSNLAKHADRVSGIPFDSDQEFELHVFCYHAQCNVLVAPELGSLREPIKAENLRQNSSKRHVSQTRDDLW